MRPRRKLTEEQRRALTIRQGELTALAQHPSWPVLQAVVEEQKARLERELLAKTLYAGGQVDAAQVYYYRGVLRGMRYVLAIAANAEARLREVMESEDAA
jgi:hypothetical protein